MPSRPESSSETAVNRLLDREFRSSIPTEALSALQEGSLRYTYRGVAFRKNPLDIALYTRLLFELQPKTIIEIGALRGGSALWFADCLTSYGIDGHVYSIDKRPDSEVRDPRLTFLEGDALVLEEALSADLMRSLGRPLLVVEDSAHRYETTLSVLTFFDDHLLKGDYIVIEDGIVNDLPEARYREYEDGPNRAVRSFLEQRPGVYKIDATYCDFFGYNYTFNPNGYLKRLV